ncbi:T4-like virus tail tube protein gp19 [Geobacter sp. OR-1]|uniref:phage tail protein n=1 Tax=Geobacter sp. OR-1 TaxID=1266765 RepID=UPI0005422FB2|nr:phage tail protein [Geobacter sp. OR-1]GAM10182.1 T4-like virus tail tube protein gp19 [Geobacter sp. OR-1]
MATGDRKDPFRAYNFLVEIDGITRAGFKECSGLDSTQDPIEYRDGGDPIHSRKLPGMVKFSNITLKRGITDDAELWAWRRTAMDGKVERKNGSIILLDDTGAEKLRWNFVNAWPNKWTGPTFNASGNEVAIESLEIAHEGVAKA